MEENNHFADFKYLLVLKVKDMNETFGISLESISRITGLTVDWLEGLLADQVDLEPIDDDLRNFITLLHTMLLHGFSLVDPDGQLSSIANSMIDGFGIEPAFIAQLAKVEIADVERCRISPESMDLDKKYKLAMTVMMLHGMFIKPDAEHQKAQMDRVAAAEKQARPEQFSTDDEDEFIYFGCFALDDSFEAHPLTKIRKDGSW